MYAPQLRIVDPLMAERMAVWALWGVINAQRKFDEYAAVCTRCLDLLSVALCGAVSSPHRRNVGGAGTKTSNPLAPLVTTTPCAAA